ncbi:MAG: metallophosphoesterase [Gemmatimonadota bacterium]
MTGRALTLFHASDVQAGSPFLPVAADALVDLVGRIAPDVIVLSGDLTQRAKPSEFETARALMDRLGDIPVVITPGNHDVPLYRFWERIAAPFGAWTRFAGSPALNSVTRVKNATIVALNSAAPRRAIVNGRLSSAQLDFAREAFSESDPEDWRVVVTHHHFVRAPEGDGGPPLPGAARIVRRFGEMGVDAVLGGHVHQIHLRTAHDVVGVGSAGPALPILATGTATSRRGRGVERRANSVCVHRFESGEVTVSPWLREPDDHSFRPLPDVVFPIRQGRDIEPRAEATA